MSCQTSRERDHGEGQHVEQHHPVHLTGHCRHHGAYIGREWCCLQTGVLWKLIIIMPFSTWKINKHTNKFTNKNPLKTYFYFAIFNMKNKQTRTQIYKQESFENILLLCSIKKWNARNCLPVCKQIIPSNSWPCTFRASFSKWNINKTPMRI